MPLDPQKLMALELPEIRQDYDTRDCILYSLGVGQGIDPLDTAQLRHVDETRLVAMPTMANVLGYPGFWMRDLDTGIDWMRVVHGEQSLVIHAPLPPSGSVIGRSTILELVDKGTGKGAIVIVGREITEAQSGRPLASIVQTVFCRGDGGFGGPSVSSRKAAASPERAPDRTLRLPTHSQMALIYRLSGDYNPLHSDPEIARRAGFERPILHGLATFGVVGAGLVASLCEGDPRRFGSMDARFSAPVYPGETILLDIWGGPSDGVAFRARVAEREAIALTNGRFTTTTNQSGTRWISS